MMTKSRSPLGLSPSAGDADDTVVDVVVESALWANQPAASAMVRHAIATAAAVLRTPALPRSRRGAGAKRGGERGNEGSGRGEVAVVLADDAAVRVLNRDWRRIDKPTNVLSFPAPPPLSPPSSRSVPLPTKRGRLWEGAEKGEAGGAQMPPLLGDIVIAYETTAREAEAEGKPFPHHLAHLAVHGFLHLLGYDHDSDETAEAMERLEAAILRRLDIADPHAHAGA